MNKNIKNELSQEYFDGMGIIENKEIDFPYGEDDFLLINIDTPFEFDKELVRIFNERNEEGKNVVLPDKSHADVWVNTTFSLCKIDNEYQVTLELTGAGDFIAKDEKYQDEVDEFDLDDSFILNEKETEMFIAVLEKSFGKDIDKIFDDAVKYQEINPQEIFQALEAGEKLWLRGDNGVSYKFTRDSDDEINVLAIKDHPMIILAYQNFTWHEEIDVNALLRGTLPMWDMESDEQVLISELCSKNEKTIVKMKSGMNKKYRIDGNTLIFNAEVTSIAADDLHADYIDLNKLKNITSIIIPDSVTKIGDNAFRF